MQDERLKKIKSRIDTDYQGERVFGEMYQDVIYLYKKLGESVPLDGLVKPTLAEVEQGIKSVIDELESDYEWGGGENGDGVLENGTPDFEKARQEIEKILSKCSL